MPNRHALTAAAVLLLTLTACSSDSEGAKTVDKPAAADTPSLSAEDRAAAREAAGLPPEPDQAARMAYLADLDALNPDIVHGKDDKAVTRGLSQCQSVKSSPNDHDKLIKLTNARFTSPDHPNGHGTDTAQFILHIVRKHICPDF